MERRLLDPDVFDEIAAPQPVPGGVQVTVGNGPLRCFEVADRDVIVSVGGLPVATGAELRETLEAAVSTVPAAG